LDVSLDALIRIVLGDVYMLHRSRVDDIVNFVEGPDQALTVAYISDKVTETTMLLWRKDLRHLILFLLITREDHQAPNIRPISKDSPDEGTTERARTTSHQDTFAVQV